MNRIVGLVGLLALSLLPAPASAHVNADWIHRLGEGMQLQLMTVSSMLIAISSALLVYRHNFRIHALVLGCLLAGMLIALLFATNRSVAPMAITLGHGFILMPSLLVLIHYRLPSILAALVALPGGIFSGLFLAARQPELASISSTPALGILVAAAVCFHFSGLFARLASRPWHHIAIRVLGSWMFAIALLQLTFLLHGKS